MYFLFVTGPNGVGIALAVKSRPPKKGMLSLIREKETSVRRLLLGSLVTMLLVGCVYGQGFSITITLDENGHGLFTNTNPFSSTLQSGLHADPGPGGLAAALTYDLLNPPGLTVGDLILLEPGGGTSDVIRYNASSFTGGTGSLVFYSDNTDAGKDLADTGFPTALYTNTLTVTEVGPEGSNGFTYTPTSGQPGFVAGAGGPVHYVIQSDTVPEPSSVVLLITVFGFLSYRLSHRRRHV